MRDEPKSVLENVSRLERDNAELKARIAERVAQDALEQTIHTRPRATSSKLRVAAAISVGLAFGLVTLAMTLLLAPSPAAGYHERDVRGGSAGVCR